MSIENECENLIPEVGDSIEVLGQDGNEMYAEVLSIVGNRPLTLLVDVNVHCLQQPLRMLARIECEHWVVRLTDEQIAASNACLPCP
ncbi:MAG: hypothetical protein IT428_06765 [Planctomycetaceae bacterium]|nr:hypothetical protein [Planctomycetaceae bacterium]